MLSTNDIEAALLYHWNAISFGMGSYLRPGDDCSASLPHLFYDFFVL